MGHRLLHAQVGGRERGEDEVLGGALEHWNRRQGRKKGIDSQDRVLSLSLKASHAPAVRPSRRCLWEALAGVPELGSRDSAELDLARSRFIESELLPALNRQGEDGWCVRALRHAVLRLGSGRARHSAWAWADTQRCSPSSGPWPHAGTWCLPSASWRPPAGTAPRLRPRAPLPRGCCV